MEETEEVETSKTCAFCNKETVLALFGIVLGLVFIGMSIDVMRRNRILKGEETNDN